IGIGNQSFDAGERFEKAEERLAVELGEEVPHQPRRYVLWLVLELETLLIAIEEILLLARRELGQDGPKNIRVDEIVDDDMRKRRRIAVALRQRASELPALIGVQCQVSVDSGHQKHLAILQ